MSDSDQITPIIRQWMEVFFHRSMQEWSHYVKAAGLSMPQFAILMHVLHCDKCSISDVSQQMEITSAAASQLIDRLVNSGLLQRTENPEDRRAKQISLTEKSRRLLEASREERYRWLESLVEHLTEDEKAAVRRAMPALIEAARKSESNAG